MNVQFDPKAVVREVERRLLRALRAGCITLANRTRELVSVPAPRKRVLGRRGRNAGIVYYRAATPAAPGAPPRKVSGQFRRSIAWEVDAARMVGRVGTNAKQGRRLEEQGHRHVSEALARYEAQVLAALRNELEN
jgi:hypothetical protein